MGILTQEYINELDKKIEAELNEADKVAASLPGWDYDDYISGPGTVIDVL
jgi:hypothetical protein